MDEKRRNTKPRQQIMELLEASKYAMSHEMLEEHLKEHVNRVTIYRTLARFEEEGLVHKIVADDGKAFYAYCRGCKKLAHAHDHAHFKCVNCDKIECLKEPVQIRLPHNYQPVSFNLLVTGLCDACN